MSPAEKSAREMIADKKAGMAAEREYNAASTTPPSPVASSPVKPKRSAAIEESIQEAQDEQARRKIKAMGYKKGGSVSSASKRADGIAQKGKTKGRMI